jgi:hypothetical protein
MILINKHGRALTAKNYFNAVVSKGRFIITLISYHEFHITPKLIVFIEHGNHFRAGDKGGLRKKRKIFSGETET